MRWSLLVSLNDSLEFENVLLLLRLDEDALDKSSNPAEEVLLLAFEFVEVAELMGDAFELSSMCSNSGILTALLSR